jgi:hypothetical protein
MSTSHIGHLPKGAVPLLGMAKPKSKKSAPTNSKTEHIVEKALPKTPKASTFESLKKFKSLKKLSNKRQKDTIYFNAKKGELTVDKKKNGFIEFFKAVIFYNFFKYTLRGFSKDKDIVYVGLTNLITDLSTLKTKAESDTDAQTLMSTVNKMDAVLDIIRRQSKPEKAGAIENLQTKIAAFVYSHSSSSVGKPSAFSPPPPAMMPPPPAMMKKPGGMPLDLNGAKLSPASHHVQEAQKPLLPELSTYQMPAVKAPGSGLGEFQAAQSMANSRGTLFRNLTEYYQEFIEARNELIRANEEMVEAAEKLEQKPPQVQVGQGSIDGPPPPPPPPIVKSKNQEGGPPPPPPPQSTTSSKSRPKLKRAPTWQEKQFASYKNKTVVKSSDVALVDKLDELEQKRDFALKQVVEVLFPEIEGLSFKTAEEVQTLGRYVQAYGSQAEDELEVLNETVERTNPLNRSSRSSSPSRMDRVESDQPQVSERVRTLTGILNNIESRQKMITAREKKIETYEVEVKMIVEEQNALSKKMLRRRLSGSLSKQDNTKDHDALQALEAREKAILGDDTVSPPIIGDIETSREAIANHEKKIAGLGITLAFEIKMNKENDLETLIAKAKEVIAEESD